MNSYGVVRIGPTTTREHESLLQSSERVFLKNNQKYPIAERCASLATVHSPECRMEGLASPTQIDPFTTSPFAVPSPEPRRRHHRRVSCASQVRRRNTIRARQLVVAQFHVAIRRSSVPFVKWRVGFRGRGSTSPIPF